MSAPADDGKQASPAGRPRSRAQGCIDMMCCGLGCLFFVGPLIMLIIGPVWLAKAASDHRGRLVAQYVTALNKWDAGGRQSFLNATQGGNFTLSIGAPVSLGATLPLDLAATEQVDIYGPGQSFNQATKDVPVITNPARFRTSAWVPLAGDRDVTMAVRLTWGPAVNNASSEQLLLWSGNVSLTQQITYSMDCYYEGTSGSKNSGGGSTKVCYCGSGGITVGTSSCLLWAYTKSLCIIVSTTPSNSSAGPLLSVVPGGCAYTPSAARRYAGEPSLSLTGRGYVPSIPTYVGQSISMTLSVRSEDDPYVVASQLTGGSLDFGESADSLRFTGAMVLSFAFILLATCASCCHLCITDCRFCRRRCGCTCCWSCIGRQSEWYIYDAEELAKDRTAQEEVHQHHKRVFAAAHPVITADADGGSGGAGSVFTPSSSSIGSTEGDPEFSHVNPAHTRIGHSNRDR